VATEGLGCCVVQRRPFSATIRSVQLLSTLKWHGADIFESTSTFRRKVSSDFIALFCTLFRQVEAELL